MSELLFPCSASPTPSGLAAGHRPCSSNGLLSPCPYMCTSGFPLALMKALQKPGKAASSSSLAAALREQPGLQAPPLGLCRGCRVVSCPQPKRGTHPVVGRIRTCAGKPQWISSPSPSPLGHNYLLQPSLPCTSHALCHDTNAQALWAKAPLTNECFRLLKKLLARVSAKARFKY